MEVGPFWLIVSGFREFKLSQQAPDLICSEPSRQKTHEAYRTDRLYTGRLLIRGQTPGQFADENLVAKRVGDW